MTQQEVARPLKVLVPLIKDDLLQAEKAGMEYYKAAGEKLLEAKKQILHGQFTSWAIKNFGIAEQTARRYMLLARDSQNARGRAFPSQVAHERYRREKKQNFERRHAPARPTPIDRTEMEASKKVAFRIIDTGYKILAQEFHPDKGGSTEAMARLNRVRGRLKLIIERTD
jgi:hypothetical protein